MRVDQEGKFSQDRSFGPMAKGLMLESWKEIAAHLNRNIRTCQMWERALGLPIHRLDGSPKARVFAFREELDGWLMEKLHERETEARPKGRRSNEGLPTLPRWSIGLMAGLAALAVAAIGMTVWLLVRQAKVRWANEVAIPEIERLVQTADRKTAFELLLRVEKIVPRGARLASLAPLVVSQVSFETEPAGAEVRIQDYKESERPWLVLGRSPLVKVRTWQGYKRFRIEKEGCAAVEGAFFARPGLDSELKIPLTPTNSVPAGMIRVPGDRPMIHLAGLSHVDTVTLADFFLDRFEVTNRQYKDFVDAGGYEKPELWDKSFVKDGRTVPWREGVKEFVDSTGRPGPAGWRLGDYPDGQADHPVSGVSWYEASAFAAFAGKRLPTCFHWIVAAGDYYVDSAYMVTSGNLEGKGPAPVGSFRNMSSTGAYDLAGNVKEWCANDIGGKRLTLGASWSESQYFFNDADRYPPMMRTPNLGFRCMMDVPGLEGPAEARRALEDVPALDFSAMKACSDEVFEVYRGLYQYAKTPLDPRVESATDWSEDTRIEKVSYRDAAGKERVSAYLFLPRRGRPPYQAIAYFPGDGARYLDSIFDYGLVKNREVEIFTRGGRAFVFPVYQEMFERRLIRRPPTTPQLRRDTLIGWYRELARCLDYLETRPDIDRGKIGYHGLSGGGGFGVVFAALETRFKAAALLSGGLYWVDYVPGYYSPERDFVHFAPRVRIPVLMQNGRYDFLLPFESSAKRLFELLGTPPADKKIIGYESGHSVWLLNEYRKDMLDFFDRYLGPVKR